MFPENSEYVIMDTAMLNFYAVLIFLGVVAYEHTNLFRMALGPQYSELIYPPPKFAADLAAFSVFCFLGGVTFHNILEKWGASSASALGGTPRQPTISQDAAATVAEAVAAVAPPAARVSPEKPEPAPEPTAATPAIEAPETPRAPSAKQKATEVKPAENPKGADEGGAAPKPDTEPSSPVVKEAPKQEAPSFPPKPPSSPPPPTGNVPALTIKMAGEGIKDSGVREQPSCDRCGCKGGDCACNAGDAEAARGASSPMVRRGAAAAQKPDAGEPLLLAAKGESEEEESPSPLMGGCIPALKIKKADKGIKDSGVREQLPAGEGGKAEEAEGTGGLVASLAKKTAATIRRISATAATAALSPQADRPPVRKPPLQPQGAKAPPPVSSPQALKLPAKAPPPAVPPPKASKPPPARAPLKAMTIKRFDEGSSNVKDSGVRDGPMELPGDAEGLRQPGQQQPSLGQTKRAVDLVKSQIMAKSTEEERKEMMAAPKRKRGVPPPRFDFLEGEEVRELQRVRQGLGGAAALFNELKSRQKAQGGKESSASPTTKLAPPPSASGKAGGNVGPRRRMPAQFFEICDESDMQGSHPHSHLQIMTLGNEKREEVQQPQQGSGGLRRSTPRKCRHHHKKSSSQLGGAAEDQLQKKRPPTKVITNINIDFDQKKKGRGRGRPPKQTAPKGKGRKKSRQRARSL